MQGEARAEAGEGLDVGGRGERASALGVDGEGQRLQVLRVLLQLFSVHRLQQVPAWHDLEAHTHTHNYR